MAVEVHIPKNRLESFSDGVLAIIITIMVLELKVPEGTDVGSLIAMAPSLLSYALSFIYIAIYWNNHHHLLHTAKRLNSKIMWANAHLLFWLSLIPFTTGWISEHHSSAWPTASYGVVLLMAALSYYILQGCIVADQGQGSILAKTLGKDWKGKMSLACYAFAVCLAFVNQWFANVLYVVVALMWFIPDQRMEKVLSHPGGARG